MHIALLSPAWPAFAQANGIVTYVHWMREAFVSLGHRVSIFSGAVHSPRPEVGVYCTSAGRFERTVRAVTSRVTGQKPTVYDAAASIARAIDRVHRTSPIDVIDMEESFGWAAEVERRVDVPVVVKLHGPAFLTLTDAEHGTPFGQERIRREGEALASSAVLIAPARNTLEKTLSHYSLRPVFSGQVVNPIALSNTVPIWSMSHRKPGRILFVGRFDKLKGADIVLLAMQRLVVKRPDLELVFVGPDLGLVQPDGSLIHFPEYLAGLNDDLLTRAVSYRGKLGQSEIVELRASAALTVVASRFENQAYTLLEAMLQGCPVVCTDNAGSAESVEHGVTGLLARSEDPVDLAAQMQRILDDPGLGGSLGAAARARVSRVHAPLAVAEQTLEVYRRAIALRKATGPAVAGAATRHRR